MKTRSRLFTNVLLGFCSALSALALSEGITRWVTTALHRGPVVVSDPLTGWAGPRARRDVLKVTLGGAYRFSTDAQGRRIVRRPDDPGPEGRPTLLLLGDSFVQGMGVADEETFAWALAHELPWRVVNLSVIGHGTDQQLLTLEQFLASHPSESVRDAVVFVYENDFLDVQRSTHPELARTKPRFRVDGNGLVREEYGLSALDRAMDVSRVVWLLSTRLVLLRRPPVLRAADGMDIVVTCLHEMRRAVEARGGRLHILSHRSLKLGSLLDDSLVREFLERTGAVDITERLRSPQHADPTGPDLVHWSAEGHRRVAAIVKEALAAPSAGGTPGPLMIRPSGKSPSPPP